jgi:glycosyl transferase family 25
MREAVLRVYLVNLQRHEARRARIAAMLAGEGLEMVWRPGLDGARLHERQGPAAATPGAFPSPRTLLSRFQIACLVSHRMAWRRFLQSADTHALVIEDDVHFGEGFGELVACERLREAPFDIVRLEAFTPRVLVDRRRGFSVGGRTVYPLLSHNPGAGGYCLNRRAATELLKLTRSAPEEVDHVMFDVPRLKRLGLHRLRVGQMLPAIMIQDGQLSAERQAALLASYIAHRRGARIGHEPVTLGKLGRELVRPVDRARFRLFSVSSPFL